MICYPVILIYPVSVKRTSYRESLFPPLTEEHEKELEVLRNMKEEDIDTDDIPKADFVSDHVTQPKGPFRPAFRPFRYAIMALLQRNMHNTPYLSF